MHLIHWRVWTCIYNKAWLCVGAFYTRTGRSRSKVIVVEIFETTRSLRLANNSFAVFCGYVVAWLFVASAFFFVFRSTICANRAPIPFGDMPSFLAPVLPREVTHSQGVQVAHGPRMCAEKRACAFASCQDRTLEGARIHRGHVFSQAQVSKLEPYKCTLLDKVSKIKARWLLAYDWSCANCIHDTCFAKSSVSRACF